MLIGLPLHLGATDTGLLVVAVIVQAGMQIALCVIVVVLATDNQKLLEKDGDMDCTERRRQFDKFMRDSLGPLLSCLVLMMWTLCVLKEFRHIGDFLLAVWNLPRGSDTILAVNERTRRVRLEQISLQRCVMATCSGAVQFTVATTLLVVGSKWLASTVSLTDLLLNAVALQFIMEIDELVFHVLCSVKIKTITTSLHPLALPRRIVLPHRVPFRALMMIFLWIGFSIVILQVFLTPNFNLMDTARAAQCSSAAGA